MARRVQSNADRYLEEEVERLIKNHGVQYVVESGTFLDELTAIAECGCKRAVIAIHDFQTNDPSLGFDPRPYSLEAIRGHLDRIYPDGFSYDYNAEATGAGGAQSS